MRSVLLGCGQEPTLALRNRETWRSEHSQARETLSGQVSTMRQMGKAGMMDTPVVATAVCILSGTSG